MAEQLGTVAYKLIENAVSPANNAAPRRSRIMDKMEELKDEIHKFHDLLKYWQRRQEGDQGHVVFQDVLADAEKKQLQHDQVKQWVVDVKDVYYTVIDVCRELRKEEMQVQEGRNGLPLTCSNPFPQCRMQIRDGVPQMINDISQKVRALKEKKSELENLLKPKDRFLQEPPTGYSFVHDEKEPPEIYFRSKERRTLITWTHHSLDEGQLISVTGPSGIGKSTLARHVYDEVKGYFDIHAWVNVSEEFNLLRIARDFVVRVTSKKINKIELAMESLSQRVRESIKRKKFLLVLDGLQDVKEFDFKWEKLERVFKCDVPGCVILVTAHQDHDVVKKAKKKMHLPNLRDEDCWSIIEHEAFGTAKTTIKNTIEKIRGVGKELRHKCQGLPVIAKALGRVLRDRTSLTDWQQVLDGDVWELGPKDKYAMKATMFSYYFLTPELKQCLLYCSIFPKNHNIDVNQLINLWMAMDSIGLDEATMETKGWDLFKALLDRSIFYDYSQQDDSGSYECKLQSAMSDFIIHDLAENECQIIHLDKAERTDNPVSNNVRHCTLNVLPQASLPASISNAKKLHTLMVLSEYSSIEPANLSSLLSKMRRLRALVLSYCSMKEIPSKACELWHLRYLDLSFNRDLKKLPLEICNLFNLQTLNLNGCDELQELPKSIGKLTKLRHLDILWTTNLSYLPKALTRLSSLRRLSRFFGTNGADSKACNLEDMKLLKNLQGYISIEGLGNSVSEAKNAGLSEKTQLRGLELWFSVVGSKDNHEGVLRDLKAPPQLKCLGIFYYRGGAFPSWIVELGNLTHLILSDCGECGTLPHLGRLESLETLEIKNLAKVEKIGSHFLGAGADDYELYKGAFLKLQKLYFEKLENWETWDDRTTGDTRRHMPQLAFLSIEGCPKLRTLPNYITRRTRLKIDEPLQEGKILWPNKNRSQ